MNGRSFKKYLLVIILASQLRETILSAMRGLELPRTSIAYSSSGMCHVGQNNLNTEDQNELRLVNSRIYPRQRLMFTDDKDLQEHFSFELGSPATAERHIVLRPSRLRRRESNNDVDQYTAPKLSRCVEMN
jgi:hypothetical protein